MKKSYEIKRIMQDFQLEEAKWVDEFVRNEYPGWLIWIAEKGLNSPLLRMFLAKFSGLEIKRAQDTELLDIKAGFRSGRSGYNIKAITTKIFKGEKMVAEKKFILNLHIPSDLDMSLFKK